MACQIGAWPRVIDDVGGEIGAGVGAELPLAGLVRVAVAVGIGGSGQRRGSRNPVGPVGRGGVGRGIRGSGKGNYWKKGKEAGEKTTGSQLPPVNSDQ